MAHWKTELERRHQRIVANLFDAVLSVQAWSRVSQNFEMVEIAQNARHEAERAFSAAVHGIYAETAAQESLMREHQKTAPPPKVEQETFVGPVPSGVAHARDLGHLLEIMRGTLFSMLDRLHGLTGSIPSHDELAQQSAAEFLRFLVATIDLKLDFRMKKTPEAPQEEKGDRKEPGTCKTCEHWRTEYQTEWPGRPWVGSCRVAETAPSLFWVVGDTDTKLYAVESHGCAAHEEKEFTPGRPVTAKMLNDAARGPDEPEKPKPPENVTYRDGSTTPVKPQK
jgi:hypothetical protein